MEDSSLNFARDLIAAFGEDRFYHALMRLGNSREAGAFYSALGGKDWTNKSYELGLRLAMPSFGMNEVEMDDEEAKEVLTRTVYTMAAHHKEFAMRRPSMPPHIHARILLGEQNEWTRKYVEALKED